MALSFLVNKEKLKVSIPNNIPSFSWDELNNIRSDVEKGSFACVVTADFKGETVVVKKLLRQHERDQRLLLKEAKILHSLCHKNVVAFKSYCHIPSAIMLENIYFSFVPFGLEGKVSNAQDFVDYASNYEMITVFSRLHRKIAEDTVLGLEYLHSKNIAHRDLKPSNILISNQHYLSHEAVREAWEKEGCVCKLADFGESRAALEQTATLCQTKTSNIDRGTPVYMAPELYSEVGNLSLQELMKCDIWSLGMVFFILLNPDLQYPYDKELQSLKRRTAENAKKEISYRMENYEKPCFSDKHSLLQSTVWVSIDRAFEVCTVFCPSERPSASDIKRLFERFDFDSSRVIKLNVSQNTVQEGNDQLVAAGAAASDNISGDASNSCSFLSLIISDHILKTENVLTKQGGDEWRLLSEDINDIILRFPPKFNPFRDAAQMYDVSEAYHILSKEHLLTSEFQFKEEILNAHEVYTKKGRQTLLNALQHLGENADTLSVAIYTCGVYIFLLGYHHGRYFLVDTHPIVPELGGDGNGIMKVYRSSDKNAIIQLSSWIWNRLKISKVDESAMQSFILVEKCNNSM